jgi:hypothetical protein
MRDPTHDSLNREESFRVEALEPRILLSADPVLGEMARIADKAGWDDPMSNLAAIVEIIDATENQDAKAAEIEAAEAEMEWPDDWTENTERQVVKHEPLDTSSDEDSNYAFGSTFVATSADLESNTQTGPPVIQAEMTDDNSAEGAHAPSAFGVSNGHNLTLDGGNTGAAIVVTDADAQTLFSSAREIWTSAYGAIPDGLTLVVGDLADGILASYDMANTITIDGDAAGAGWFIDTTPTDNTEYTTLNGYALEANGNNAAEGVDLLTVMLHEIGHAAGLEHTSGLALMGEALAEGERLLLPTEIPTSLSDQLYYQVTDSGGIIAYSDAALSVQVLTTGSPVTTLIGLAGNTDALVGADVLFGGSSPEGIFKVTGLTSGTLSFTTSATTDYSLTYSNIGLLRGGNDTDTALYVVEGENFDSVWDITSVNAGTLTSETGEIRFENIGKLVGGTEDDAIIYATGGLLTHGFDDSNDGVYEITVGDFVTLSLGDGANVTSSFVQNEEVTGFVIGGAEVMLSNVDVVTMTVTAAILFAGSDGETYFTRKANNDDAVGTGVEGENFDFELRYYRQAYTDGALSGYHVWVSLDATIDQLTLINADAIKGSIGQAGVLLNVASEGAVIGTANTTDAVVLREASAFTTATAEFASVTGTAALIFQEKSEPTQGNFTYTDVAYFAGGLTLTKTTADVVLPSNNTVFGDLLVFQLADASAFIGTGMELPNVLVAPADVEFDTTNAEGVLATDLNFSLGLFKTQATDTVASVIYGGVSFTTAAESFGLAETKLIARELSVKLNVASDLSTALDWTQDALKDPADVSYLALSFNGIELLADVEVEIANTVLIAGQVELSVKTQTIDDGAITATNATVVTFKLRDGFFAAGVVDFTRDANNELLNAPITRSLVDDGPNGVSDTFKGFYASGVGFELALIARNADSALIDSAPGFETWLAFRATVENIDVKGLGGPENFAIVGRDFLVTGNFASLVDPVADSGAVPTVMNWKNLADDLTGPQLDLTDAVLGLNGLEQFKIGGTLTLEITNAVYLTSTFSMAVASDVLTDPASSIDGDLIFLSLSETTFFAGGSVVFGEDAEGNILVNRGNASGVYVENAGLALGVLIDKGDNLLVTTDDITYLGLTGGFDLAQLLGLGNVEAQANDVALRYNAAIDASGEPVAKLDWSTIDYTDAATALGDLDSGTDFAVEGRLFFGDGLVYLDGGFSLATGSYTVSSSGIGSDFVANVTTFSINDASLFAGVGGGFTYDVVDPSVITGLIALADLDGATGFNATGVSAELAFITEDAIAARSWTAIDARVGTADLVGLPDGFVASVKDVYFSTNIADEVSDTKLNWNALTLDSAAFATVTGLAAVGATDNTLGVVFDNTLGFSFGGSFRGEIDGTVLLAGSLTGDIIALETLDALPGTVAVTETVNVMSFTVSNGYLFAGVGGSFTTDDGVVTGIAAGGTGFTAADLSLDFLSVSQGQTDPTIVGTTQTWTALKAGAGQLDVRGINGIDLKAYDLEIRLNAAATTDVAATATKVDWTTLSATDAPVFGTTSITDAVDGINADLDFSVAGAIEVAIEDNVLLFGAFSINAQTKTINDGNGIEITDASVLSFSISGATLFAGAGGALVYDGTSGRAIGLEDGGTGIAVQDANLEIAIISEPATGVAPLSWLAVAGEIGQADLRGIDGITAIARNINFRFNGPATNTAMVSTKLDWSGINDFDGTRIGTIDETLDLSFGGEIELNIQNNVIVAATFAGTIQTVSRVTDDAGITVADAQLIQFNLSAAYLFIGDGGAFTRVDDLAGGVVNGVADQGTGFAVTNAALNLYVVNETAGDGATTVRSWTALYATASEVAPRGLPVGLEIAVTDIEVVFNKATVTALPSAVVTDGTKLDWVNVAQFTAVPDVFDAGTDLKVAGTLTLDAFGFVDLGARFDLQVISGVQAQLDTDAALENAKLLLLGLTLTDPLFIGQPGGVGISVGSGNLAVALLSAVPDAVPTATVTTIPSATAITASLGNATITNLPDGIDFNINSLTLDYYSHVPLDVADPGFSWKTVVVPDQTSGDGVLFNYGPSDAPLVARFNATADTTLVTGSVSFSAFDFIAADATFSFAQDIVDVDVNSDQSFDLATDMDNASLTRVSLGVVGTVENPGLTIGIRDGPGVSVASAELVFASITSSDPILDARGYFGLKANIDTATLEGVDVIAATLNNGALELNSAATKGSLTPLTVLDWNQSVNLDSTEWDAATVIDTASYDVLSAINGNGIVAPETDTVLDMTRDGVALYADATIIINDFIYARGEASLVSEQNVAARTLDNATSFNTTVLRLGLANVAVFAGNGVPDYLTDAETGRVTGVDPASNVTGVTLNVSSLGVLLVKESPSVPGATTPLRSWYAIKASGDAALLGVDGLVLSGTLNVTVNGIDTTLAPYSTLDFSDADVWNVTVGENPRITFDDLIETVVEVRGSLVLGVEEYVFISGEFAFRKGDALLDVVLSDGMARTVSALTVGARNVNIFVGTGYDIEKTFAAQTDLVGLKISNGFVALALLQSVDIVTGLPIAVGAANAGAYTALNAGGDVQLVGIDGLTLAAYDFEVKYNAANIGRTINFDANNLIVPTGLDAANDVTLSMAAEILEVTGFAVITIDQYVFLSGTVTFSKGLVIPAMANPTTKNFAVTQISGSNINAFIGVGGPYFQLDIPNRTSLVPANVGNAVGVAVEGISFDLALLSQVELSTVTGQYVASLNGDRYTALYAEVAGVNLVGVGGVALASNNVKIKVNQGRAGAPAGTPQTALPAAFDFTEVTGLSPGATTPEIIEPDFLYVFKEQGFKETIIGFEAIGTTAGTGLSLLINTSGVTPTSVANADFALQADVTFERTTLRNGSIVTKISATNVTASLGTIDFAVTGNALILLTPAGLSANIDVTLPAKSFTDGRNIFAFDSPTFRLELNTSTVAVKEEFKVAAYTDTNGVVQTTRTLDLPAGKFIRITGENLRLRVDLGNATGEITTTDTPELEFGGTISLSTFFDVTDPANVKKRTIFVFSEVTGTYTDPDSDPANPDVYGLTDAKGVIIYYAGETDLTRNGLAGQIELTAQGGVGDFAAEGTGILRFNTTGRTIDQTVDIGDAIYRLTFTSAQTATPTKPFFIQLGVADVTLTYDPYLTITGSVNTLNIADYATFTAAGVTSGISGRNISIFLGDKGADLEDTSDDVGLLITNTQLVVLEFVTSGLRTFAIYAKGEASVVGIDGLRIQGAVEVWINNSGKIIETTQVSDIPRLDADDMLPSLAVKFVSGTMEMVLGGTGDQKLTIGIGATSAENVVVITSDAVQFTRTPLGVIEVFAPDTRITVNPEGDADRAIGLGGAARFSFGGGNGFQLSDIRLTSYTINGQTGVVNSRPRDLVQLSADLAAPLQNQIVRLDELKYIDVIYNNNNYLSTPENPNGIVDSSITDNEQEFIIRAVNQTGTTFNIEVSGAATRVEGTAKPTFRYEILSKPDSIPTNSPITYEVEFLANSWKDSANSLGAREIERFSVLRALGTGFGAAEFELARLAAAQAASISLAKPFSGATVDATQLNAAGFIDVTFRTIVGQRLNVATIDGNEIRISAVEGAANVGGVVGVAQVSATTWRYFIAAKPAAPVVGVPASPVGAAANTRSNAAFSVGDVKVDFIAGTWSYEQDRTGQSTITVLYGEVDGVTITDRTVNTTASAGTVANPLRVQYSSVFTVANIPEVQTSGLSFNIGPVTIEAPSVGLDKLAFKDGRLILTIAIGADRAALAFGSTPPAGSTPSNTGGTSVVINGLLVKFDVGIDVLATITGGEPDIGFTGKWEVTADSLIGTVPEVLTFEAFNIKIGYDPDYDASKDLLNTLEGAGQKLVQIGTVRVTFPSFGLTGLITGTAVAPGLIVYENGFSLKTAQLIYGGLNSNPTAATATRTDTQAGPIKFGTLLEFDDLRIGVTDFSVVFGQAVTFNGSIFFASGGARFAPGKPISADIRDRAGPEPADAGGAADNTEAIRLGLTFTNGVVDGFIWRMDTFRITLGPNLVLTGKDLNLDTGAAADEELISFAAIGAELTVGSVTLIGEARQFAFLGDGTFVTKRGFGVFIGVGSATGSTFKWPAWLPIRITEIGVQWADIQAAPEKFVLTLSATITGLQGNPGLKFEGTVRGIQIDVGALIDGGNPIIGIESLGVSISGNVFGGQIEGTLIGGIIKVDANGNEIGVLDTETAVADRVFFIGVEAGYSFAGLSGFTIRFALSELGPLGVLVTAQIPGGILLEPISGLTINNFTGGVDFFTSLPDITTPGELTGPAFQLPANVSVDGWLDMVRGQVLTQYRLVQANPSQSGFAAAFQAPMVITGSAKLYSIYTSELTFNGQVTIKISTDGKILVIGQLNFAADNLSLSARLYANLSKIASGEATILFLAKIPDQIDLITIEGSLRFGFQTLLGDDVAIAIVQDRAASPTQELAGPGAGTELGQSAINNAGYIDVTLDDRPTTATGVILDPASVLDLAPELILEDGSGVVLDDTLAPVHLSGTTYRFWVIGTASSNISYTYVNQSWSYLNEQTGAVSYSEVVDEDSSDTGSVAVVSGPWIDIRFIPEIGADLTLDDLRAIVNNNVAPFTVRNQAGDDVALKTFTTSTVNNARVIVGDDIVRFFFDDSALATGTYAVTFNAGGWTRDGTPSIQTVTQSFSIVNPTAKLVGPFGTSDTGYTADVNALNAGSNDLIISFRAPSGNALD